MSSSSSVAAPAVVDKHAELLKMVNKCTHYKCPWPHTHKEKDLTKQKKKNDFFLTFCSSHNTVVRTFCMHCYMILIEASPNTVDCRLGMLCGCGVRYCGIKCLVAAAREHKALCADIQESLQFFEQNQLRATATTNRSALKWHGPVQIELLRADLLVATSDVVDSLAHVANDLRDAEAFELAQKFAQRALSLAAKDSLDEARALTMLGMLAEDFSKYDAAVAHYEAALKLWKSLGGDDFVEVAIMQCNLSGVFRRLGRLDEALAMSTSALEIFEKAPGDNQNRIAMCHNHIGANLDQQGKRKEAMEHYSIGLAITLETEGETAEAANSLANIGFILSDQNKPDEAIAKFASALRIYDKAKLDLRVASCHFNIGEVLMHEEMFDAALEHARKSLAIRRSKLPHEHADCGESHMQIGEILGRSGKVAEALDEYENALRIRKNVYGEMTLEVAEIYHNLAICFFELEKSREAVTFFEATIHIRTVLLGADDEELVDMKAALAAAEEDLMAERLSAAASGRK